MNIKSIIVGSLAVGLAIGGTLFNFSFKKEKAYSPRTINNGGLRGQAGYAEYLYNLKANPATGEIDYNFVEQVKNEVKARAKKTNNKALLGLNWTQMGPDNVGGRARAVLVDRNNPNTVYAGSVAGGLYVSYNAAQTWQSVAGHNGLLGENLAVSCITQTDNGRIFFGTGSSFENAGGNGGSGFIGNGVYEYVPSTGQVLPVITNATAVPNNNAGSQFSYVNAIASYGNRLYLGTKQGMFKADPDGSGLYPTTLSGWTNPIINPITSSPETGSIHDVDVASDGSMLVCLGNRIYMSDANDNTFTQRLISSGRMSGAIAPSNPNVFYLVRTTNFLLSLEISLDKGQNWDVIVPGAPTQPTYCFDPFRQNTCGFQNAQGIYDQCIAIDPNDWGHIIVGGIQLFEWNYNPNSNPIGGNWFKSANLFESSSNPYYVHADKHTIVWPTSSTVYIGGDGGVFKSTDGGETWAEKNLGFNVTTFYDMDVNENGWMLGGTQDNGTQLFTYGLFGTSSPLGTFEVTGGDGFDCCFSSQGPGIAFTTIYYGDIYRAAGGVPGQFAPPNTTTSAFHTVISNWERNDDPLSVDSVTLLIDSNNLNGIVTINPIDPSKPRPMAIYPTDTINTGDTINYESLSNGTALQHVYAGAQIVLPDSFYTMKIQDPIQNKFVTVTNSGIYYTRDASRLNELTPEWFRISNINSGENFEFSPDGNHLFVGTSNGQCWRISGLSMANDSTLNYDEAGSVITATQITGISGGGYVGMAIDPQDGNNLIITKTGYFSGTHVYRCTNALSGAPTAEAIQGSTNALPFMPVYDACVDMNDKNKVILGTEWGVWTSDNAFSAAAASVEWNDESGNGMAHVPVFAVEQQTKFNNWNTGYVYLGTHGRGFYMTSDLFTSIEESPEFSDLKDQEFVSDLNVYPNPINNAGTIDFNLNETINATVNIYNLSGALVETINLGSKQQGNHKVRFDASALSVGTYILSLESETERKVAKFIVNR